MEYSEQDPKDPLDPLDPTCRCKIKIDSKNMLVLDTNSCSCEESTRKNNFEGALRNYFVPLLIQKYRNENGEKQKWLTQERLLFTPNFLDKAHRIALAQEKTLAQVFEHQFLFWHDLQSIVGVPPVIFEGSQQSDLKHYILQLSVDRTLKDVQHNVQFVKTAHNS